MAAPNLENQAWCIQYDLEEDNFEFNSSNIHHLPKFAGVHGQGDTAMTHLKEFDGVCNTLCPRQASEERFKLRAFPYSLTDFAKTWFLSLPANTIYTWEDMKRIFIKKYYPAAKASQVRRELSNLKQGANESTYDYWERFDELEQNCSPMDLSEKTRLDYYLDGLRVMERQLLDAAAGGSIMNLTMVRARELIRETAETTRFRDDTMRREENHKRNVSQVGQSTAVTDKLTEEIADMKYMMKKFLAAQDKKKELEAADVNAMGGHPNYGNRQQQSNHQNKNNWNGQNQQNKNSLEDIVKDLAGTVKDMGKRVDQLTEVVTGLVKEKGKLPLQTVQTPKSSVNAITVSKKEEPKEAENEEISDQEGRTRTPEGAYNNRAEGADGTVHSPEISNSNLVLTCSLQEIRHSRLFEMDRSVSLPFCKPAPKLKDKGTIAITCIIDENPVSNCMLDIGAAINVIPFSIYSDMFTKELIPPDIVVNLANISSAKPVGKLTDVVVRVGKLNFFADFYIMHTEKDEGAPTVILGRPFMMTAKAKIDVFSGAVSLEVDDKIEHIKGYTASPHQKDRSERLDPLVQIPIINHLAVIGQVKEEEAETGKKPPRHKKKRGKKKKPGVVARVSTVWIGTPEKKNITTVHKFDLNQPWDPNL